MPDVSIALIVRSTGEDLNEDLLALLESAPAIDWHVFAPAEGIVRVRTRSLVKIHDLRAATSRTACWLRAATWLVTFTQSTRLVIATPRVLVVKKDFLELVQARHLGAADTAQADAEILEADAFVFPRAILEEFLAVAGWQDGSAIEQQLSRFLLDRGLSARRVGSMVHVEDQHSRRSHVRAEGGDSAITHSVVTPSLDAYFSVRAAPPDVSEASVLHAGNSRTACAVIIPCHNYGKYLSECLDSVLSQTHAPAEILVVDDASTDETPHIARAYSSKGVRYTRIDARDPHIARRCGIDATISPVVCCLDADDRIAPDYLARGLPLLEDQEVGVVWSKVQEFGDRCNPWQPKPGNIETTNWIHAGAIVRRSAIEKSGAFQGVNGRSREDWEVWKRILRDGWKDAENPSVYFYRKHRAGRSRTCPDRIDRVVAASYFISQPDPQRNVFAEVDRWDAVAPWAEGIKAFGLRGVIFHDGLSARFANRLANHGVECVRVDPAPVSTNCYCWRHRVYAEWLGRQDCETAFFTDLFDVKIASDPFELLTKSHDLWVGVESERISDATEAGQWMMTRLRATFGRLPPDVQGKPILNAGVLGGFRAPLLGLLHALWAALSHRGPQACDMSALNGILYRSPELDRVWRDGAPLNSVYRRYETNRTDVAFIHK